MKAALPRSRPNRALRGELQCCWIMKSSKLIWWALVGILLIGFAITDGMDMGVGALLPFLGKTDSERPRHHQCGRSALGRQPSLADHRGRRHLRRLAGGLCRVLLGLLSRHAPGPHRSVLQAGGLRLPFEADGQVMADRLGLGACSPAASFRRLIFGVAFGNLIQGVPFHLDEFLRPHFDAQFLWALIILLKSVRASGRIDQCGHAGPARRALAAIANRARACRTGQTVHQVSGIGSPVAAFALAGIWVAFGIEGYRVVSQPPIDALPNPLNKEVVREAGALMAIYGNFPVAILAPLLGLAMPLVAWVPCPRTTAPAGVS